MIIIQVWCESEDGGVVGSYIFTDPKKAQSFMKERQADQPYMEWFACFYDLGCQRPNGWCMCHQLGDDPEKISILF